MLIKPFHDVIILQKRVGGVCSTGNPLSSGPYLMMNGENVEDLDVRSTGLDWIGLDWIVLIWALKKKTGTE